MSDEQASSEVAELPEVITEPESVETERIGRYVGKPLNEHIGGPFFLRRARDGKLRLEIKKVGNGGKVKAQNVKLVATIPITDDILTKMMAVVAKDRGHIIEPNYFQAGLDGVLPEERLQPIVDVEENKVKVYKIPADKVAVDRFWYFKMIHACIDNRTEHYRHTAGLTQLKRMLGLETMEDAKTEYQKGLAFVREKETT